MARLLYGALIVNFTIDAASNPSSTKVPLLITQYYTLSYNYIYGLGSYVGVDTTASDPKGIIDSDEFRGELNSLLSSKVQLWNEAGKNKDGSVRPMPIFNLKYDSEEAEVRDKFTKFLDNAMLIGVTVDYMDNVRLWGSDYSDRSGVFY